MKFKIGFVVASTLFLIVVLSTPLAFAQTYTNVGIIAYCIDVEHDEVADVLSFTALAPLESLAPNLITFWFSEGGDPQQISFSPGDRVVVDYIDNPLSPQQVIIAEFPASSGNYSLSYGGAANSETINTVEIPEFPSWTLMLVALTVVAVAVAIYKRKLSKD